MSALSQYVDTKNSEGKLPGHPYVHCRFPCTYHHTFPLPPQHTATPSLLQGSSLSAPLPSTLYSSQGMQCPICGKPANGNCGSKMCKNHCVLNKGGCHLTDHKASRLSIRQKAQLATPSAPPSFVPNLNTQASSSASASIRHNSLAEEVELEEAQLRRAISLSLEEVPIDLALVSESLPGPALVTPPRPNLRTVPYKAKPITRHMNDDWMRKPSDKTKHAKKVVSNTGLDTCFSLVFWKNPKSEPVILAIHECPRWPKWILKDAFDLYDEFGFDLDTAPSSWKVQYYNFQARQWVTCASGFPHSVKKDSYLLLRARGLEDSDCLEFEAFEKLALSASPHFRDNLTAERAAVRNSLRERQHNAHINVASPSRHKRKRDEDAEAGPSKKRRFSPAPVGYLSQPSPPAQYPFDIRAELPRVPYTRSRSPSITVSSPRPILLSTPSRSPSITVSSPQSILSSSPSISSTSLPRHECPQLNRIQEDKDCELQKGLAGNQQQLFALPGNSALVYYSPDNVLATALDKRFLDAEGKGRADPKTQEGMGHNMSVYESNYQEVPMSDQPQSIQASTNSEIVQYPPQKISRDQHSESCGSVEIKGGTFNQTHGHHVNVTIQVNPPREEQYDALQQHPHLSPLSPPLQTQNPNLTLPPPQDIRGNQISSIAAYPGAGPSMLTSTTISSPDNSDKIYARHLERKKKGFPLWIPEPNRTSPMPYRRKGVDIGDVGIIMPSGGFLFLFNICLPHDHPCNPATLPDDFVPIQIDSTDIYEHSESNPESYLASEAIEKTDNKPSFHGLSFSTSAAKGAILTLPDGAISRDLVNIQRFRTYAAANIESWYRYVNGTRGCEAKNGDVRLVTGCVKATSWGMAVIANRIQHKVHNLKYCSVDNVAATTAPIPLYRWEYTGFVDARVGPDLSEIEDLKRDDRSDAGVEGKYRNQCLFIHTLNILLEEDRFVKISQELDSALIEESQRPQHRGGSNTSTSSKVDARIGSTDQQQRTNSATLTRSTSDSLGSAAKTLDVGNAVRNGVIMTRSPSTPILHPADVLNKILLQKVPNCVVITHDEDWCFVIKEDDEIMLSPSEIAERVLATHHIRKEDGVVFLELKEYFSVDGLSPPRQISSEQLFEERMDSQKHTSSSSRAIVGSTSLAQRDLELAFLTSRALNLRSPHPPIYGEGRSFGMDRNLIPLLYHHQPPSPNNSSGSSSASGSFGHQDVPMRPVSGIQGYSNGPYQPRHMDLYVTPQYMPTQALMTSHPSSPNAYMTSLDGMEYINYPDDGSSPASSPATSFDSSRQRQQSPQPNDQETEDYLRNSLSIPPMQPVNLWSLPNGTKPPKISDMIKLAIWGSPNHILTLHEIYEAIENRYPSYKDAQDKPWQRSIRHNLSLKAMFVREERPQSDPGKGYYWTLNVNKGEGNKRDRKRKDRRDDHIKDQDEDADFSSESQGDPDPAPFPSTSLRRSQHRPDNTMYSGNLQQTTMQGQQYITQSSQGMIFDQHAGQVFYDAGMGHQNIPFQTGHIGPLFPQANPAQWGTPPALNPPGNIHYASAPGIPVHNMQYHQQDIGSSHRRNPTGGNTTRSRQRADRQPLTLVPVQGSLVLPMVEGVSHSLSRSLRRSHPDTSPEDDVDERTRSAPRLRSGHRS